MGALIAAGLTPGIFRYEQERLLCEEVDLAEIAGSAGTPCYVYSSKGILENFSHYHDTLKGIHHQICYAVKANSNLAVLRLLADAGCGFDIVSGGELFRVLRAGGDPAKVVFSGVGKTAEEIGYALAHGIHSFNCESEAELVLLDALAARHGVRAQVAVRVNPDVNPVTHPYISTGLREHKFGIDISAVEGVYERAQSLASISTRGVSCHIGSQILDFQPLLEAMDRMLELAERLRAKGIEIDHLDLGGGLGVAYAPQEQAPEIAQFLRELRQRLEAKKLVLVLEPGRSIVGNAGVLLTRVLYRKRTLEKEFVVVDAAMNDLIRPALYQSHHEIIPVRISNRAAIVADVVGPVCETGDFLARNRKMENALPGDLLGVCTAGAYGFVAASNYNSRPRPPEVLVEGDRWRVVRARESLEDLVRPESV